MRPLTTPARQHRSARLAALGLALIARAGSVSAEAPPPATSVELVSAVTQAQAGQPFWIGVQLSMAPGWHTYWKNPGDAGMATRVRWDEAPGVQVGPIQWPAPERIETVGDGVTLVSYGYEGQVALPMEVRLAEDRPAGAPVTLSGRVDLVECKDVCVRQQRAVTLTVPVGSEAIVEPSGDARLQAARDAVPAPMPDWDVEAVARGKMLLLTTTAPPGTSYIPPKVSVFPEDQNTLDAANPKVTVTPEGHRIELPLSKYALKPPRRLRAVLRADTGWQPSGQPVAIAVDVPIKP